MKVVASTGRENLAVVYIIEYEDGRMVECVESLQPPLPREKKWVLLVSTMFGCPVGCMMCDAGGYYQGKPSAEQIFEQIDFLVDKRYPDRKVTSEQFKIQFARMGEPSLNKSVLQVLDELPQRYQAPGLMPSLSTIAPHGAQGFFEELLRIKRRWYGEGRFQFQFSLHTTDEGLRERLIPIKKWSFAEMAAYGERFHTDGDLKVTLNFALAQDTPVDPAVLLEHFDPGKFLVKITPLNPTYRASESGLATYIDPHRQGEDYAVIEALRRAGYQVILSIGAVEENNIGSNCGQYLRRHLEANRPIADGYTYRLQECEKSLG